MTMDKNRNIMRLVEVFLAIAVYAVSMAVCIRIIGIARVASDKSADLSRAVSEAQNIAECYKAAGGSIRETGDLIGVSSGDLRLGVYYDENWRRVAYASAYYAEVIVRASRDGSPTADIIIWNSREELYRLTVAAVVDT